MQLFTSADCQFRRLTIFYISRIYYHSILLKTKFDSIKKYEFQSIFSSIWGKLKTGPSEFAFGISILEESVPLPNPESSKANEVFGAVTGVISSLNSLLDNTVPASSIPECIDGLSQLDKAGLEFTKITPTLFLSSSTCSVDESDSTSFSIGDSSKAEGRSLNFRQNRFDLAA